MLDLRFLRWQDTLGGIEVLGRFYYASYSGIGYSDKEDLTNFFGNIADRIIEDINPLLSYGHYTQPAYRSRL